MIMFRAKGKKKVEMARIQYKKAIERMTRLREMELKKQQLQYKKQAEYTKKARGKPFFTPSKSKTKVKLIRLF